MIRFGVFAVRAVAVAALFALGLSPARANEDASLRRFVIVASANNGGAGRTALRFADSDAQSVAQVLRQLGGVNDGDVMMVPGATRSSLQAAFKLAVPILQKARKPGVRIELFVYYSGHSDEEGLLLGDERVTYAELRSLIESAGADVRIAILDSCASGALIRSKGGKRGPSFLVDASSQARGHAFLTASSADEAAQESDRIGAAFFTHYLLSGLRGAADSSRDGRVTLNEAYQFAFHETLLRTQSSRAGAQHPAYDIALAGTGDLVMTDLQTTSSRLVVAADVVGRIYIRDANGRLLVEMRKEPGYPVELGLPAGAYRISVDKDGRPFEADLILTENQRTELGNDLLRPLAPLLTQTRGSTEAVLKRTYKVVPADLMLVPNVRLSGPSTDPIEHHFVLGLINDSDRLIGIQLALGANLVRDELRGVQLSPGVNVSYGPSRGVQMSGVANVTMGPLRGLQLGGFANLAWQDLRGAQIGNINFAKGGVEGAQIGVANMVQGDFRGAQVGVVNIGGTLRGAQVGVVNIAGEFTGAQVGVVNYARKGRGVSFGLLPIVLDGYNRLQIWTSDITPLNLGFKLGTQQVYVLLGGGLSSGDRDRSERIYAVHAGIGFHLTLGQSRFFVDTDVVHTARATRDEWLGEHEEIAALRVNLGFQIMRHLAVTLGPTANVAVAMDGKSSRPGKGFAEKVFVDGDSTVRIFPGFNIGVQF